MQKSKIPHLLFCLAIVVVFFVTPAPLSLESNAWNFLGIFIAVILAVILQVMPLGAVCLIAIAVVALSGITTPNSAIRSAQIKAVTPLAKSADPAYESKVNEAIYQAFKEALIASDQKEKALQIDASSNTLAQKSSALNAIYTEENSKNRAQRLKDETTIAALSSVAISVHPEQKVQETLNNAKSKLKASTGIKDALSGFSNSLIWLIVVSIIVARGVIKTGLGERLSYYFISIFGKKTIGIAYSIALSETVLAPVTPSNTARAGAIINPIVQAIARTFKSTPEDGTQSKIGTYLSLVNYQANPISSAMFITATAPNPLVVDLVAKATNLDIQITWGQWALGMLLPGLAAMALMPLIVYFLSPPKIKETPNAREFAKSKLNELGAMKRDEKIMLSVFAMLLLLWAGAAGLIFGITLNATTIALLGLTLVLVSGVLSFREILAEKTAWNTLVWFSALVMMATMLGKLGVTAFLAQGLENIGTHLGLGGFSIMIFLSVAFLYAHYFFASTTAHITAMFFVFYSAGLALGAPPLLYAFIMLTAGNVMMTLTHYATGTAPVIFGTGYVSLNKWWGVGFVMSVVNMIVMISVGLIWWKILGFY